MNNILSISNNSKVTFEKSPVPQGRKKIQKSLIPRVKPHKVANVNNITDT